jgi:hypothetical protein
MTKWLCGCGEVIHTSGPMPNPAEWLLISDERFDEFSGMVDAETVYRSACHAFRCDRCGRLHVFWDGMGADPTVYSLD